jgi:uncharacterized protein (TIGR02391 family)
VGAAAAGGSRDGYRREDPVVKRALPPERRPAQLSLGEIRTAIPKLERRLAEVEALQPESAQSLSDPTFRAVGDKIDSTLVEVYGHDTLDYKRFSIGSLYKGGFYMGGTPLGQVRDGYRTGKEQAAGKLKTAIEILREKLLAASANPTDAASSPPSLDLLDLDPQLGDRIGPLFRDGHYANAIEDACKVLDLLVKLRSGRDDLSGTELMQTVFSERNPVLKFNDGVTDTDRSEQKGMMFLYAGTMLALRNPRAHGFRPDDAGTAIQVISFINFLISALNGSTKA